MDGLVLVMSRDRASEGTGTGNKHLHGTLLLMEEVGKNQSFLFEFRQTDTRFSDLNICESF